MSPRLPNARNSHVATELSCSQGAPRRMKIAFTGQPALELACYTGRAHSFWLARRAPSARAPSFAQAIAGSTVGASAKVAKPQSTPAMTFSRPTTSA